MIIKHELQLDLVNKGHMPQIYAVQGDDTSRVLAVALKENGNDWPIPDGVVPLVRYRKPDGTGGVYDTLPDGSSAWYTEAEILCVFLAPQMLTVPGCVETQLQLTQGSDICASFSFQVLVEEDPSIGVMESYDYVSWNQWAKEEIGSQLSRLRESGAFDGATFMPEVSEEGVLTWTNDQGKENPEEVNILDLLAGRIGSMLLPLSGGTMTGNINMGGNVLTGLTEPVGDTDAVRKAYADGKIAKSDFFHGAFEENLDNCTAPGWYWLNLATCTNSPETFGWGFLEVISEVFFGGGVIQRFTEYSTGEIWVRSSVNGWGSWKKANVSDALLQAYPVGAVYISCESTSPASLFGGTWTQIQNRFLLAAGGSYAAGSTGGEAAHTLSVSEMPYHTHALLNNNSYNVSGANVAAAGFTLGESSGNSDTLIGSTGGGAGHNNMPPYLAVYMWRRTA